jgi:hypothetical protein
MFDLLAQVTDSGSAGSAIGGGVVLFIALVGLLSLVLWIWALIDCIRNPALEGTMRIVWLLVIIFTGVIGAVIYLLVGRGSRP